MSIKKFDDYFLNEKKGKDLNKDGKIDSADWKIARDNKIKKAKKDEKKAKKIAEDMESCKSAKEYEECCKKYGI